MKKRTLLKKVEEFNFLSPDGFTISIDNFETPEKAKNFLIQWVNSFKKQGYYSLANREQISLDDLINHCEPITFEMELLREDENENDNFNGAF